MNRRATTKGISASVHRPVVAVGKWAAPPGWEKVAPEDPDGEILREWEMREFMGDGWGTLVHDLHPHRRFVWKYLDYYYNQGFEQMLLPVKPGDKSPMSYVKYEKRSCVYTDFGREEMSRERLQQCWIDQPWCNLGLLTGSRTGIVAIDIDRPKSGDPQALGQFEKVMAQVKRGELLLGIGPSDTTCYLTPRGAHLLYRRPCALKSVSGVMLSELGLPVDVKGEGGMVVVPPSQTGNRRREFLRGLDWLKELPRSAEVVRSTERVGPGVSPVTVQDTARPLPRFHVRDHLCAEAIAKHDIPDGKRHDTLPVLFSLLVLGNTEAYARMVVGLVNKYRCKPPLPDKELEKCTRKPYCYSCEGITQMLPEIKPVCEGCRKRKKDERSLNDMVRITDLEKMGKAGVPVRAAIAYLMDRSGLAKTRVEMAESMGISERALYDDLKTLRDKTGISLERAPR